jgi:hypothetical protein
MRVVWRGILLLGAFREFRVFAVLDSSAFTIHADRAYARASIAKWLIGIRALAPSSNLD